MAVENVEEVYQLSFALFLMTAEKTRMMMNPSKRVSLFCVHLMFYLSHLVLLDIVHLFALAPDYRMPIISGCGTNLGRHGMHSNSPRSS